jgi:hypothetical protein
MASTLGLFCMNLGVLREMYYCLLSGSWLQYWSYSDEFGCTEGDELDGDVEEDSC